jgi:hypothetical protein
MSAPTFPYLVRDAGEPMFRCATANDALTQRDRLRDQGEEITVTVGSRTIEWPPGGKPKPVRMGMDRRPSTLRRLHAHGRKRPAPARGDQ